ncbi:MAG: effector binding domain-containing protein [Oscillospiraceae bacterium]|nr:effector binding domain-containing protein [Oscillospiraceae bacterium]
MMISPESYYEEYLKGKTKEEIMTAIRGLKQEIGHLKNSMENPYDGMKTVIHPSEDTRIYWSREYLDIAKEAYSYRMYDESAVRRLQQIITLRKLRLPLKKIALILNDMDQVKIVKTFQESVCELDAEIAALETIRNILCAFIAQLNTAAQTQVKFDLFDNAELMSVMQTLSLTKIHFKEGRSMDDLNRANETLSTLTNVRVIYLPPCTVAASYHLGVNPEDNASKALHTFIRNNELEKIKPDLRVWGFNNPSPSDHETYGYELWVTIPDALDVPAPLQKKQFSGGLYAAHCIKMGDFQEWQRLHKWVENSTEYAYDAREPLGMGGCLEEHLNAYSYYKDAKKAAKFIQLDLLTPITLRDPVGGRDKNKLPL